MGKLLHWFATLAALLQVLVWLAALLMGGWVFLTFMDAVSG